MPADGMTGSGIAADATAAIDWAAVDWTYVIVLAALVLVAAFVGNLLSFRRRGLAALLTAVVFAALFVAWSYYPHGLPLPTRLR